MSVMAKSPVKVVVDNRKARFNYELLEKVEAGIVLTGTEVKSLREGKLNLGDAYCVIDRDGETWLQGVHISPYSHGTHTNHEPLRRRKLLLHRREIDRLVGAVERKGYTLVPLQLYWKRGRAKLEIGLAKGKRKHDKREAEKQKDWEREKQRLVRHDVR